MLRPPMPVGEAERLRALRSLGLLDTPAEERFDRITRLACRLFGVPAALVTLVDADRQWFKSAWGVDASQTPRDVSFCGHAILCDEVFVVSDTEGDPRFADNPLVTGELGMRFYAGCPLRTPDGLRLGTLCVIDRVPRAFGDEDRALLEDLARMAEQELSAIQLATMDPLTSLSNRRGFEALAQHALRACQRTGAPATALILDLDGFGAVNDAWGRAEGDRALADFAELLRQVLRDADLIGRLDRDAFVVLRTGATAELAAPSIERLRGVLREREAREPRGYALRFSVGAVEFVPARHTSIHAMLAEAESLMRLDKQTRRAVPRVA